MTAPSVKGAVVRDCRYTPSSSTVEQSSYLERSLSRASILDGTCNKLDYQYRVVAVLEYRANKKTRHALEGSFFR